MEEQEMPPFAHDTPSRIAYRKWRAKNGDKAREAYRAWYANNAESECARQKEYYKTHRQMISDRAKEYYKRTKQNFTTPRAPKWKSLVQVAPLITPAIPEEYSVSFD